MSSTITIQVRVPADRQNYVESSARMRNISETQMMRRVIDFVLQDQMILSILDDGDRPSIKTAPTRNARTRPATPALVANVKPQRPNAMTINFKKRQPKTKAELLEELAQAVRNTAGLAVE